MISCEARSSLSLIPLSNSPCFFWLLRMMAAAQGIVMHFHDRYQTGSQEPNEVQEGKKGAELDKKLPLYYLVQ
jgi:hypothetical protein